jgi:UDP-N-acetylglucosamine 1-carboxyvinyltransferase
MEKLEVFGAEKLRGQVKISGSKNASLPILVATLLSEKQIYLNNIPKVKDIETMLSLLNYLGSKIKINKKNDSLEINNCKISKILAPYNLVKTMRAGILVLGPLLARFNKATVSFPGGCLIGSRPIDIHLKALAKLGVHYKFIKGYVHATVPNGLVGAKINFEKISVGATENIIIAAARAEGETILSNCAIEPEIQDLINFLNKMGCKIKWVGKRKIRILGVKTFKKINYSIMFDRIEAGTMLIAGALIKGNLNIMKIDPKVIKTEIDILKKIGVKIKILNNQINVSGGKKIKSINISTAAYPGFPTDLQAQIMVLLCKANKKSIIKETIFENRFMHVPELNRMGAKIKINGNKATIQGNINFEGSEVTASDLRASVSLVLAALSAKGKSTIHRIYHLDRGYEEIEKKFKKIGVKIKRVL